MNPLIRAIDANLRVSQLQDDNAKPRAALEQVEWVCGWCSENCPSVCPWCEADGWGRDPHHAPDCARQIALACNTSATESNNT